MHAYTNGTAELADSGNISNHLFNVRVSTLLIFRCDVLAALTSDFRSVRDAGSLQRAGLRSRIAAASIGKRCSPSKISAIPRPDGSVFADRFPEVGHRFLNVRLLQVINVRNKNEERFHQQSPTRSRMQPTEWFQSTSIESHPINEGAGYEMEFPPGG